MTAVDFHGVLPVSIKLLWETVLETLGKGYTMHFFYQNEKECVHGSKEGRILMKHILSERNVYR